MTAFPTRELAAFAAGLTLDAIPQPVVDHAKRSLLDAAATNDATLREFGSNVNVLSQVLADEDLGSGTTGKKLNEVLVQAGEVLAANRENIKGIVDNANTVSGTTVDHQRDLAEFLDPALDVILDGGACPVGVESTIVDFCAGPAQLLRAGGITPEEIAELRRQLSEERAA